MRLIMMGTGPFAVPTFQQLYEARHDVALLVTKPLRSHRGKEVEPASPMRDIAQEHATPIFDPENINTPEAQKRLVAIGGRPAGGLRLWADPGPGNPCHGPAGRDQLHGSLLPKYRGAAPINWAIYNGETETGVTVIHMTPQGRRRALHRPGAVRRSAPTKQRSNWNRGWPRRAAGWCGGRSTRW